MFFFKISVEEKLLQLSPTNLTRYSPMLNSYIWSITTCIDHFFWNYISNRLQIYVCKHCKGLFADQVKFDMSVLHRVRYMFQVYTKILGILPKNFIWSNPWPQFAGCFLQSLCSTSAEANRFIFGNFWQPLPAHQLKHHCEKWKLFVGR